MEAVTAGNEVALDFLRIALVGKPDLRPLGIEVVHGHAVDLEQQRAVVGAPLRDQVPHNFLLAVDGDALVHQLLEVEPVNVAVDADIDAPMWRAFALHARADADFRQQIGRPMLHQAGANAVVDVPFAAVLDDDGLDALQVKKPRQHQAGGARSDDADLGAHIVLSRLLLCALIDAARRQRKGIKPGMA